MASSSDPWMRELSEAFKLADDINTMISERGSFPTSDPDTQRHTSAIRRKITILGTKLDSLDSLLSKIPSRQSICFKVEEKVDKLYPKREEFQWRPSPILCKRFDLIDPFMGKVLAKGVEHVEGEYHLDRTLEQRVETLERELDAAISASARARTEKRPSEATQRAAE